MRRSEDALVSAEVTRDDVEDVIARWTGIPVTSLKEEETQKLLRIEARASQARRFAATGDLGAGSRYSPIARRSEESAAAGRVVPVPWAHRCRQN